VVDLNRREGDVGQLDVSVGDAVATAVQHRIHQLQNNLERF
jgi:hypothetical protein